ncbi:hypothetical protein HMPREF9093_00422 [Fusobacterium sp. oral taxon 370 str. F0437]|uniref:hypothetical protein n=1 Tax=Fusobacterium sp. oral taxon 370 TaxID=712288 RepID=UPI000234AAC9|nr:hypothetical protein [Fusobacterium sp. oral taxon 370]EHI79315.1 hypothetical protein HMPREF9093_00422 [Fusobacterium sp. oral taxon 370 str. F0437]
MDILVFLFFKLFIFWAILTVFEVAVIHSMKVSTFKYIKVLKFLEISYVILIIISIDFYLHIGTKLFSYLIYSLFIIIYFGILIYDFWKKKITKKDFIIYFIYFFIDVVLVYLSSIMAFLFFWSGSYV